MSERAAYLRDGTAIYERSFAIIRAEADLARFTPEEERVAVRIIHSCGMVDIALRARRSCATPRWWRMALPARGCRRTTK